MVRVRVLFFGVLKDIAGASAGDLEVAEGARLGDVFDHYAARFPALGEMRASIMLARNQEFAAPQAELADNDEVALLPPVSGGAGPYTRQVVKEPEGHFFGLTRVKIDAPSLEDCLLQGHDGAIVTFKGVARNNTRGRRTHFLEYECYDDMAIKLMAQIGDEIARTHAISRIAIVHRLGRILIGDASVVIVVTAPHRKAAFEAAMEGINRLKKTVPIWKKEFFADGEVWVEGEWDDSVIRR